MQMRVATRVLAIATLAAVSGACGSTRDLGAGAGTGGAGTGGVLGVGGYPTDSAGTGGVLGIGGHPTDSAGTGGVSGVGGHPTDGTGTGGLRAGTGGGPGADAGSAPPGTPFTCG